MGILEPTVLTTGVVLLVVQAMLAWSLLAAIRRLRPMEDRVAHFGDALSLLTETTETGFRAAAVELQRLSAQTQRHAAPAPSTTARLAAAARRGRSVQEIAAKERLSEGEVRLRLTMSEQAKAADKVAGARKVAQKSTSSPSLNSHAATVAKAVRKVREARAKAHGSVRA